MEVRRLPIPKLARLKHSGFTYMLVRLISLPVISIFPLPRVVGGASPLDSTWICELGKAFSLSLASVSWFVNAVLYL